MPTATLSLNFSAFEALVDGLSTGVLRSTNASGFSVHVVDQGGTYSANGLGPTTFHQEIFLGSSAQARRRMAVRLLRRVAVWEPAGKCGDVGYMESQKDAHARHADPYPIQLLEIEANSRLMPFSTAR